MNNYQGVIIVKSSYFNYGIASIIAVLVSASLAPTTVFAADSAVLEEIVVTAQRRAQNIQDVPIAVTAFSGEDLEKSNISGATQYLARTPNVSFTEKPISPPFLCRIVAAFSCFHTRRQFFATSLPIPRR